MLPFFLKSTNLLYKETYDGDVHGTVNLLFLGGTKLIYLLREDYNLIEM